MEVDSPNQFVRIENLDFVHSLIINGQYDTVDGFQEK